MKPVRRFSCTSILYQRLCGLSFVSGCVERARECVYVCVRVCVCVCLCVSASAGERARALSVYCYNK